ncbi:hypothetical protein JQ616_13495 [Bradyrhizobium tropiciagri]|uniref:hypothetical protein n=1 Tax=Bradyrhizobium tropiciagri TaxID=312253 RepID=UPI001BA77374|nr:hypothetical protein [Bradyrhizobium tropiciagri]MBR0895969.1 hypothetical protein [Bradyrhizobium tropiciagri]
MDKAPQTALSSLHRGNRGRQGAVLTTMDWSYYLVGGAVVLLLLAYRLHGGLFRKDTLQDERLNRLIDERIERMDFKRENKHEPSPP